MNKIHLLWILVALALAWFVINSCMRLGSGATTLVVLVALLPDVALIGGFAGQGLLRPSRVKFYNVLHSPLFAAVLAASGLVLSLGGGTQLVLLGGATWLLHIAIDRACGYGFREHNGTIRPVGRTSRSARSPVAVALCSR